MKLNSLRAGRRLILFVAAIFSSTAIAGSVTVKNCGESITFDSVPECMVVHDINMSEIAFSLGLQDRMVGVTGISGWY